MGEIILSWIHCNKCDGIFPIESYDDTIKTKAQLEKTLTELRPMFEKRGLPFKETIPKFCPYCASADLDFSDLSTEYYG